ncbi:hypothetical protein BH10PSE17_BH10PSE17_06730 [soil metagenome]
MAFPFTNHSLSRAQRAGAGSLGLSLLALIAPALILR